MTKQTMMRTNVRLGFGVLIFIALGTLAGCAAVSPFPIPDPDRPGIHHVTVYVEDVERSATFYVKALGFKRVYDWPAGAPSEAGPLSEPGVFIDSGDGSMIALRPVGEQGGDKPMRQGFTVRAADTKASYERAIASGAGKHQYESGGQFVVATPRSVLLRGEQAVTAVVAYVTGPDGEVIGFFQSEAFIRPTDVPRPPSDYEMQAPGRR